MHELAVARTFTDLARRPAAPGGFEAPGAEETAAAAPLPSPRPPLVGTGAAAVAHSVRAPGRP